MTVKTLDTHIKKAFETLGFGDDEVKKGCWLLERKDKYNNNKLKPIAWIATHKFLERVAERANINFELPEMIEKTKDEICILVKANKGDRVEWTFGEAGNNNLTSSSAKYRYAMAEKRAKDRLILKLIGVAGDMYSEEESDEFKQPNKKQYSDSVSEEFKNNLIDQISKCESMKSLCTIWKNEDNQKAIKRLSVGDLEEVMKAKNSKKEELEEMEIQKKELEYKQEF